jgi:hypothetical protein
MSARKEAAANGMILITIIGIIPASEIAAVAAAAAQGDSPVSKNWLAH